LTKKGKRFIILSLRLYEGGWIVMKSNKKRGGRTGAIVALCIVLVLTVVLGVLGAAGWSIPPKGLYRVMPWLPNTDAEAWPQVLPLGLDLRGGMYVEYSAKAPEGSEADFGSLMNGTISVESEKGKGTEFTVVVTLKNCEQNNLQEFFINPRDMRVLVVDDEEIAAEHARIILDEAGIKADTCLNGKDALHMLEVRHIKHEPYNLVLLDWKMPEMDGIEVAKEIRKSYSNETTIIILTSFNREEIMDEAVHIGVDGFLAKPLFASSILEEFERSARKKNISLLREKQRADLNGLSILLAEDVLINAEIMKELLSIKNMHIDHAENGKIALEMFEKSDPGHYSAVLMDVRMPEMDGLEATKSIRNLSRTDAKTVPIIAMTANAFDEDVQLSLQAGMNAHLSKPVEPEHLYRTLEELIWEAGRKNHAGS